MQVVLDESAAVVRAERGVLICRTHHGFVCANAGVDASNAPAPDDAGRSSPATPTPSARALRAALPGPPARRRDRRLFGRAWRHGQATWRSAWPGWRRSTTGAGAATRAGRELQRDGDRRRRQAAAAADLARAKDSGEPAVVVRGLERHVTADDGPGAAALRARRAAEDLFR